MSRIALLVVATLALAGLPACGGGGGGGGGGDSTPTLPGELTALAIQGLAAPGGGTFDFIPTELLLDTAANGWVAFVTPVGGVDTLFVAQPDGVVVRVFAVGEIAPEAPFDETIEEIECIWMCDNGTVMAYLDLNGTREFALVSAIVDAGAVSIANGMIYEDEAVSGLPNGLTEIDYVTGIETQCRLFILARDEDAQEAEADDDWVVFGIDADGSNPAGYMRQNAVFIGGQTFTSIDGFGVSADGAGLGIAATLTTDGQGMFSTATDVVSLNRIAQIGDQLKIGTADAALLQDVYKNESPILVFPNGDMLWVGFGPLAAPDQVLVFFDVSNANPLQQYARSGDDDPGSTGNLTSIDLLHQRVDAGVSFPMIILGIANDPSINISVYALSGTGGVFRYLYDGREFETDVTWNGALPGIRTEKLRDGDRTSSFAFRDTLTGGTAPSGIFWGFPSDFTPLAVALEGDLTPDETDTFGSFENNARHTVAEGVLAFRVTLVTAGSGLFRQGP